MASQSLHRIKLTLQYDGADFHGWQIQPEVRTVQGELDAALSRLADRPIRSVAAGRTDAGVHAVGQVVTLDIPDTWDAAALRASLNAILPEDIRVSGADAVDPSFHALHTATARGYIYRVGVGESSRSPFRSPWCWPVEDPLDRGILDRAAEGITGEHSFRGYAKSGQPERGYRCTVHEAGWREWAGGLEFRIVADRFLHHMVRYLVGTMVDAARGRRPATHVTELLDEDRLNELDTSPPAPAEGLFLARAFYTDETPTLEGLTHEDLP